MSSSRVCGVSRILLQERRSLVSGAPKSFGSERIAMISLRKASWSAITVFALSGAVQFGLMPVAHAEEDSAAETAAARTLAVDGLKLAKAGKCEDAIPKLDRAEKPHHSAIG